MTALMIATCCSVGWVAPKGVHIENAVSKLTKCNALYHENQAAGWLLEFNILAMFKVISVCGGY